MKHTNILICLLVQAAFFSSCSFNPAFDYEQFTPVVTADSVTLVGQDSIMLHGTVLSSGGTIDYWGTSYSEDSIFFMSENQALYRRDRYELGEYNQFSSLITGLPEGDTFYYQTFAANSGSYGISPVTAFVVPSFAGFEAPCELTSGMIELVNDEVVSGTRKGEVYSQYGDYAIVVSTGGPFSGFEIKFDFPLQPTNGVYNVKEFSSYNYNSTNREVFIRVTGGWGTGSSLSGGKLYVTLNPDGSYILEFCDIEISLSGSTFDMIGKVEVN